MAALYRAAIVRANGDGREFAFADVANCSSGAEPASARGGRGSQRSGSSHATRMRDGAARGDVSAVARRARISNRSRRLPRRSRGALGDPLCADSGAVRGGGAARAVEPEAAAAQGAVRHNATASGYHARADRHFSASTMNPAAGVLSPAGRARERARSARSCARPAVRRVHAAAVGLSSSSSRATALGATWPAELQPALTMTRPGITGPARGPTAAFAQAPRRWRSARSHCAAGTRRGEYVTARRSRRYFGTARGTPSGDRARASPFRASTARRAHRWDTWDPRFDSAVNHGALKFGWIVDPSFDRSPDRRTHSARPFKHEEPTTSLAATARP